MRESDASRAVVLDSLAAISRVLIVFGGRSSEAYEISCSTAAILTAIDRTKWDVIDSTRDGQ